MKNINRKTIIIMIVVALVIIAIGVFLTINKAEKENYIEQGLWLEKEYPDINTKEEALKTLKTVCGDCEATDEIEMEGLWIFKSETNKLYYGFNNEIKIFSELMTLEEGKTKKEPLPEDQEATKEEEEK